MQKSFAYALPFLAGILGPATDFAGRGLSHIAKLAHEPINAK
jgi:hypothetical protein